MKDLFSRVVNFLLLISFKLFNFKTLSVDLSIVPAPKQKIKQCCALIYYIQILNFFKQRKKPSAPLWVKSSVKIFVGDVITTEDSFGSCCNNSEILYILSFISGVHQDLLIELSKSLGKLIFGII